jgi:formylglycine-generating enzyme required for sulfatase activity
MIPNIFLKHHWCIFVLTFINLFLKLDFYTLRITHITFFLFFCIVSGYAQRLYHAFDVLDGKTIVPPNGILIHDSLFLDDSEVMNSHYMEYLHSLSQDSTEEHLLKAYPDTAIFGTKHLIKILNHHHHLQRRKANNHLAPNPLGHDKEIHEPAKTHHWWNYFSYHGTKHHPVVGISYQQAVNYCKWRSDYVSKYFNDVLSKKSKYKQFRNQTVRFEFSLPDEKTWELAAAGGLDPHLEIFGQHHTLGKTNLPIFKVLEQKGKSEPAFIFDNPPNEWGFYNMVGNVAEMVAEAGRSKGGSFAHYLDECAILKTIIYTQPEKWLGFRCQCKMTTNPKAK